MAVRPETEAPDIQAIVDENELLRAALADARARLGEAEEQAARDPLTLLADSRQLEAELERVISQAERHKIPAALISVDLDGLDALVERHGRIAGDAALRHVAKLLESLIRSSDVAARAEDGHFVLLLDHLDPDSAIDTAERIARCVAGDPLDLGHSRVSLAVTVSAASILPGDTAAEVLSRAARNRARMREF